LETYGLRPNDADIQSDADMIKTADLVASGEYAAFIIDLPLAQATAQEYPNCQLAVLTRTVDQFDLGIGFRNGTNPSFVSAVSEALQVLLENGEVTKVEEEFIPKWYSCSNDEGDLSQNRISFQSVYGLWVILVAATCLGFIIAAYSRARRMRRWDDLSLATPPKPVSIAKAGPREPAGEDKAAEEDEGTISSVMSEQKSVFNGASRLAKY
jgi:hypothetical protein